jgi:hypothetical protein
MAEIEADLRPMNPEHAKMSRMWLRRSWRGSTDCRSVNIGTHQGVVSLFMCQMCVGRPVQEDDF